jgi:hypothetical protein
MNSNLYIVYNVVKRTTIDENPHNIKDIIELYKLLLKSDAIVNIEQHWTPNGLESELRVIFWSEAEYDEWAAENRVKYDDLILSFHNAHSAADVEFNRYTSNDEYVSKFPYTYYPPKNQIICWTLLPLHLDWFVKHIIPIGNMIDYKGNGIWDKSPDLTGSRFLKERTSSIVRRPHDLSTHKGKIPTWLLMYTFDHAMQTAMYDQPYIYRRFMQLTRDAETLAETFIEDCDHAAVLIGHESLDNEFIVHTHRVTEENRLTLTIAVRVTFNGTGLTYKFWDPIPDDDPNLLGYYSSPALLKRSYTDQRQPHEFKITARSSILVFSGSHVPHSVTFDNDLYLFYVWDNVNFKPGMLEKIKQNSQYTFFQDQEQVKRLYFYNL